MNRTNGIFLFMFITTICATTSVTASILELKWSGEVDMVYEFVPGVIPPILGTEVSWSVMINDHADIISFRGVWDGEQLLNDTINDDILTQFFAKEYDITMLAEIFGLQPDYIHPYFFSEVYIKIGIDTDFQSVFMILDNYYGHWDNVINIHASNAMWGAAGMSRLGEIHDQKFGFTVAAQLEVIGDTNQPVPEPSTMLLFGAGLTVLVGTRTRMKKK